MAHLSCPKILSTGIRLSILYFFDNFWSSWQKFTGQQFPCNRWVGQMNVAHPDDQTMRLRILLDVIIFVSHTKLFITSNRSNVTHSLYSVYLFTVFVYLSVYLIGLWQFFPTTGSLIISTEHKNRFRSKIFHFSFKIVWKNSVFPETLQFVNFYLHTTLF